MAQAYPEPREKGGVQLISEKYRYSCKRQERQSIAVDISPALCCKANVLRARPFNAFGKRISLRTANVLLT